MVTEINTPNVDAHCGNDPQSALELAWEFHEIEAGFGLLSQYTNLKAWAIEMRLAGNISGAMDQEKHCGEIYARLPKWAKW